MRVTKHLFQVLHHLVPLCALALAYLYLYPVAHGCSFPSPGSGDGQSSTPVWFLGPFGQEQLAAQHASRIPLVAPFRLLALGDPQLEGDSSLPNINKDGLGAFPSLAGLWANSTPGWSFNGILGALGNLISEDIPTLVEYGHKRLDLLGNDFYLAHVYRTTRAWTRPTHVAVLGDLLGSQWIGDEEFSRRSDRFWTRVFRGASQARPAALDSDDWSSKILTVAGNHDIGYAGDIDEHRIARFEQRFGPVNWQLRLALTPDGSRLTTNASASQQSLRLIMLNSMNLDTPTRSPDEQGKTYDFLNDAITSSEPLRDTPEYGSDATVLLTHIPLHKPAGVCADSPHFAFFPDDQGGGVKEQNHLSEHSSQHGILEGLYGMKGNQKQRNQGVGRNGIILTGHDHVGCDVWHYWNQSSSGASTKGARWTAVRTDSEEARKVHNASEATDGPTGSRHMISGPGIREITVRSMMGEFGGNAGLLSAWFDADAARWRFEYSTCSLGVQHVWWAIHVLAVVTAGLALATLFVSLVEAGGTVKQRIEQVVPVAAEPQQPGNDTSTAQPAEILLTPKRDGSRPATAGLNRSESKRLASEFMKQRREKYQRSIRGRKEVDGGAPQSESTSSAVSKASERDWEIVDSDPAG